MIRRKSSIRLNAIDFVSTSREGGREEHTRYKYILIWCSDKLHRLLREECHVLVDRVVCNILVGAVVEGNQDVEQYNHDDKSVDIVEDEAKGVLAT
jgi:hypothetical protein